MKIGYVRVSSESQNTARQEELMRELGVEKLFVEKVSGKNANRPQLQEMLSFAREGDTIIVSEVSRLARNVRDLLELVELFAEKNIEFISKKEAIDTTTPSGKFMLTIFGAVSELERDYIRHRQREGIEIARKEGKYKGRRKTKIKNFNEVYDKWSKGEITATKATEILGVSRSTFYRRIREYRNES